MAIGDLQDMLEQRAKKKLAAQLRAAKIALGNTVDWDIKVPGIVMLDEKGQPKEPTTAYYLFERIFEQVEKGMQAKAVEREVEDFVQQVDNLKDQVEQLKTDIAEVAEVQR